MSSVRRQGHNVVVENDSTSYYLGPTVAVYDGTSWYSTLWIPRAAAKGNLRKIWNEFVTPNTYNGPGATFAHAPYLRRLSPDWFTIQQHVGLDV
jgi:hypothetical protein